MENYGNPPQTDYKVKDAALNKIDQLIEEYKRDEEKLAVREGQLEEAIRRSETAVAQLEAFQREAEAFEREVQKVQEKFDLFKKDVKDFNSRGE